MKIVLDNRMHVFRGGLGSFDVKSESRGIDGGGGVPFESSFLKEQIVSVRYPLIGSPSSERHYLGVK